jgi:poly-gamma-glutamate capsule biosynthesis protein CapA/YwtB (metallophosphatase superfamily)
VQDEVTFKDVSQNANRACRNEGKRGIRSRWGEHGFCIKSMETSKIVVAKGVGAKAMILDMIATGRCFLMSRMITHFRFLLILLEIALFGAPTGSSPVVAAETNRLTITLTGQTMIRSDFRATSPSFGATISPLLQGDVVFTNFESTVAEKGEPNEATPIHGVGVLAPPEALDALMGIGFNLISYSNNHAWDMMAPGILNAVQEADRRNLVHAGSGATLKEAAAPAFLRTSHGTVGFVAQASGLISNGAAATSERPGVNELRVPDATTPNGEDAERILQSIRDAAKKSNLVIVYQHNHVYEKPFMAMFSLHQPERFVPPPWIKDWVHREIDAGADIIVMHGAPVVQGVEIYHDKPIFYDLGNFMFNLDHRDDQVFDESDIWESVVATAVFDGKSLRSIRFRPIVLNKQGHGEEPLFIQTRGMPSPVTGPKAREILENLAKLSQAFNTTVTINGDVGEIKVKE